MKINAILNGVKVEKEIPTGWDQVTFGQALKLMKCQTDTQVLSVFTEIDEETLKKATIKNLYKVINAIGFTKIPPSVDKIPDQIRSYEMPKNIEIDEIGRYEDLKLEAAKIQKDDIDSIQAYAMFCAIYATTPYDYKQAERLKDYFMQAPCEEVMAIGNFTVMKLIELNSPGLLDSPRLPSLLRNWKLAISAWLTRLAFTVRYYSWKRKLRLTEKNS